MTSSTVVRLRNKEELLGVVSSHVEYKLNSETKEQTPDYNLSASEREVMLRFIGNRAQIKMDKDDLPNYMFKEDFNTLNQLTALTPNQVRIIYNI